VAGPNRRPVLDIRDQVRRLDRVRIQEALLQSTSRVSQPIGLLLVFDTLSNQIDLHAGGQSDLATHQSLYALVVMKLGYERAIDLEPVDGDVQQIRHAGVVGPEIVYR
jgi:hypothetical protein